VLDQPGRLSIQPTILSMFARRNSMLQIPGQHHLPVSRSFPQPPATSQNYSSWVWTGTRPGSWDRARRFSIRIRDGLVHEAGTPHGLRASPVGAATAARRADLRYDPRLESTRRNPEVQLVFMTTSPDWSSEDAEGIVKQSRPGIDLGRHCNPSNRKHRRLRFTTSPRGT